MRKILLVLAILMALFGAGCGSDEYEGQKQNINPSLTGGVSIRGEVVIEGCQYFVVGSYGYDIITHKGNCTNSIHRR